MVMQRKQEVQEHAERAADLMWGSDRCETASVSRMNHKACTVENVLSVLVSTGLLADPSHQRSHLRTQTVSV